MPTPDSKTGLANSTGRRRRNRNGLRDQATLEELEDDTPLSAENIPLESTEDIPICFICAEPIKYWALSRCNHRTCHVCALRLRALYKRLDCTFCKEEQPLVIFTLASDRPFSSYSPDEIPLRDGKLGISFETQEMMEETLILLRFNCSDTSCDFIAGGWNDLKMHVRAVHGRQMCDLCIKFKKVFAHEHYLYTHAQLSIHLPSYGRRPGAPQHLKMKEDKDKIEGGVHSFCEFCKEAFFGGDELFAHMREMHEECFICKRSDIHDQYFVNYASLERHFNDAHFPCISAQCQAQKFVVFASKLDLQGHIIEVHQENMSTRDKKEARRVVDGIEFEQVARANATRSNRVTDSSALTPRSSRRDAFGAQLTIPTSFPALPSSRPEGTGLSTSKDSEITTLFDLNNADQATLGRHRALISRICSLTSNSSSAVTSVKLAIRSYLASESGARDLISTIFTLLNQDLEGSASILNGTVDLLEDEAKSRSLLAAWNGFKIEQRREFPELRPNGVGSSYSGISSGRVLNAKQSTLPRTLQQSTRNVLDRVADAAASTSSSRPENFPSLAATSKPNTQTRVPQSTAWSSASSANKTQQSTTVQPFSVPGSANQTKSRSESPKLSNTWFPSLPPPSSTTALEARQLVNGVRNRKPNSSIWGSVQPSIPVTLGEPEDDNKKSPMTKGKKKKGKEKQTLFTLGTFPT